MLRQRILTALVLAPVAIGAVWFLPGIWLAVCFAGIALLGMWEWSALSGVRSPGARTAYVAAGGLLMAAQIAIESASASASPHSAAGWLDRPSNVLLAGALLWWLWVLRWLRRYPQGFSAQQPSSPQRLVLGLLIVPAAIAGLERIRASSLGPAGVLSLFALVWAADIGAYFAGSAWGRRKLAPKVSPGKTVEGLLGGLAGSLLVGSVAAGLLAVPQPWTGWLLLCALTAMISVVGDLFESLLKRQAGVKDSGTLLPGHGGVLDRIDSLLAASPLFALGLFALGL